jgi:hypothetical protein
MRSGGGSTTRTTNAAQLASTPTGKGNVIHQLQLTVTQAIWHESPCATLVQLPTEPCAGEASSEQAFAAGETRTRMRVRKLMRIAHKRRDNTRDGIGRRSYAAIIAGNEANYAARGTREETISEAQEQKRRHECSGAQERMQRTRAGLHGAVSAREAALRRATGFGVALICERQNRTGTSRVSDKCISAALPCGNSAATSSRCKPRA